MTMTLSSWTNKPVCALYDSECGGNPLDDANVTRKPATFNGPAVLMGDPSLPEQASFNDDNGQRCNDHLYGRTGSSATE
jgi:hypothetical protein